jgi:hypothetical protein
MKILFQDLIYAFLILLNVFAPVLVIISFIVFHIEKAIALIYHLNH